MKFFAKSMLLVVFFVSAVVAEDDSEKTVIITTGSNTGFYYKIGKDIKKFFGDSTTNIDIKVIESDGSQKNINRLLNGKSELGIVQSDVWRNEHHNNHNVVKKLGLILPLYEEEVHLLARSHIKNIEDLKGKQVVIGTTGSGTWFTALNILETLEITAETTYFLEQSSYEGIISVLKGKADAVFYVIGKDAKVFKNFVNLHYYQEYRKLDNVHFIKIKRSAELEEKGYFNGNINYSWFNNENDKQNGIETVAVKAMLVGINYCNTDHPVKQIKDDLSQEKTLETLKNSENGYTHEKWKPVKKIPYDDPRSDILRMRENCS